MIIELSATEEPTMMRLSDHLIHLRERFMEDALIKAMPLTYRKRAALLEWARPRPNDYTGKATEQDLADLDERCRLAAQACRKHADLLELGLPDYVRAEIDNVMGKAA